MKKYLGLSIILLSAFFAAYALKQSEQQHNPLLVVLLMIKNEANVMEKTLEPFLKEGVGSYVILDTGSTDNTIEVTKKLFKKYNIKHGHIIEQPFVDFATSRNYAIQQAERLFPHAGFFVMLDAEWYTHGVKELLTFCKEHINSIYHAFLFPIRSIYKDNPADHKHFYLTRLFKPHKKIRFSGAVHEEIFGCAKGIVPDDTYFVYNPTRQGMDQSKKRNKRDLEVLLNELKKHPNDTRTLFYLGQTHANLRNFDESLMFYKKSAELTTQKTFKADIYYCIATLYEVQNQWEQALHYYLQSYDIEPAKADSLIRIAEYYWYQNNYALCYMFAKHATSIEHPDGMMTEKYLYDYTRHNLLSGAAWHMKDYKTGLQATKLAMKIKPNAEHLKNNLTLYQEAMQTT